MTIIGLLTWRTQMTAVETEPLPARADSAPTDVRLFTIPGSHPGTAVRLMLEHKGIEHKRTDLLPVASWAVLRALRFPGVRVPAIKIDGRRVQGSREITRELERVKPQPPLFPADPDRRAAVEEAERFGDEDLQQTVRQILLRSAPAQPPPRGRLPVALPAMADPAPASDEPRVVSPAIERASGLLEAPLRPEQIDVAHGYLDLLGRRDPTGAHPGQRLMLSRALPLIYQRFWRPLGGRLLMGLGGPDTAEEHRMAVEMLSIAPGDRVLDVGCGPGNFTRDFADAAGEGLVVGLDASESMLGVAVRDTASANVAYLRGDASALPFRDRSFDAVCCFAALYLIEDAMRAVAEIVRVLAPGGRVALLTSCNRGLLPARATDTVVRGLTGVRIFGRAELTAALAGAGLIGIEQRVTGLAQFVSGRRPG
jgi:SAM-dependent methyltransferase/glutathione S-transferase